MRLTAFGFKGVLFYLALVLAFFATPYSNLFFLLIGFLTLQWVLSVHWTLRNARGVTATIAAIEPGPAGSSLACSARIRAGGRTRFQLAVELELESGERAVGQADVVDGEADVLVRLPPLPRGVHGLRGARLVSSYPLGLLAVRRALEAPDEIIVYPAPAALAEARSTGEALAEALGERSSGAGDLQPAGLRDHREGDEPRAIHWRATARRGSLVVKEFEGGGGAGLELLVDRRCAPDVLEEALSVVSAVVLLAREHKELLVLHSQGLQATFGAGHRPWREALRFLAAATALPADGPAPPPVSPGVTRLPHARCHAR